MALNPLAASAVRIEDERITLTATWAWYTGSDNTTTATISMTEDQAIRLARDLLDGAMGHRTDRLFAAQKEV